MEWRPGRSAYRNRTALLRHSTRDQPLARPDEPTLGPLQGILSLSHRLGLWRARRQNVHYLRTILKRAEAIGRPRLVEAICRHGLTTKDHALFARKLADMGINDAVPVAAAE